MYVLEPPLTSRRCSHALALLLSYAACLLHSVPAAPMRNSADSKNEEVGEEEEEEGGEYEEEGEEEEKLGCFLSFLNRYFL